MIFLHKQNYSIVDIEIIMAIYGLSIFIYTKLSKSLKIVYFLSNKHILIISEIIKIIGLFIMVISTNIVEIVFDILIIHLSSIIRYWIYIKIGFHILLIIQYIQEEYLLD